MTNPDTLDESHQAPPGSFRALEEKRRQEDRKRVEALLGRVNQSLQDRATVRLMHRIGWDSEHDPSDQQGREEDWAKLIRLADKAGRL